ncbi:hypothetical protein R5W23_004883 [Gemmata sp. JC673]|uniref:Uncharacterized protein n=1 Tax=Gemmata algarum TaxID=2975278 RepID=A0ABU5F708_9BACT|nr:hypothetical protein [Gemmata algarum]MDY3563380.1 hypothetical protein [Gemmata algarum]
MTRPLRFRPAPPRPDLTAPVILAWADAFHARTGRWPSRTDGTADLPDTTWSAVDGCLKNGSRGLPGGSSLAKLLLEHRGRRHHTYLPALTPELVLAWADAHRARAGTWPGQDSGPIDGAPGETWSGVNCALAEGCRGLPGGSSLTQLLQARRGARNHLDLPALAPEQILAWADAHRARTGRWPRQNTGPIDGAPGETWSGVSAALLVGCRGLAPGGSLARLLAAHRGARNPAAVPKLQRWEVLLWADAHHARTGNWPTADAGPIPASPGDTWSAVDAALQAGTRGLPGGDSLARLLDRRGRKPNFAARPALTVRAVLAWADAHQRRTGAWPTARSGPIDGRGAETWRRVDRALRAGARGLPGGSSLARLLGDRRGVRTPAAAAPLTPDQILTWADAHRARTGAWPTATSGAIDGAAEETWSAVAAALETGSRGLPGGDSLARLLAARRGVRNHMALPPFTVATILAWADAHHTRTGAWPSGKGGAIPDAPGETWRAVEAALGAGLRGLPGGDTLARLLARRRGARNRKALPALAVERIRRWVRAHHRRTGTWPRRGDGPIPDAPGETWHAVDQALYRGLRGLPGGSSLPQLVRGCRAAPPAPGRGAPRRGGS